MLITEVGFRHEHLFVRKISAHSCYPAAADEVSKLWCLGFM